MQKTSIVLLLTTAVACAVDEQPDVDVDADQLVDEAIHADTGSPDGDGTTTIASCTVAPTDIHRSLVVRDAAVLARFSFARVMSRIQATANVTTTQTRRTIFQAWMRTFGSTAAAGDCNDANIDPNKYGLVCPRAAELKLASVDPFVSTSGVAFRPIALFNRFDLAPASGAHCGEYRIVYAMSSTNPNISGRAFIIFEGALPNPRTDLGSRGCLPVARFWHDLSRDPDVNSRATKLERFYFVTNSLPGFTSAVHARHYGLANGATAAFRTGQVRTNFFVDNLEWHLREFKLRRVCTDPTNASTCTLRFDHVTVKTNPAEELFIGTHARSASFRSAFVNSVPTLARTNVNLIGMSIADVFNEFESVSQSNRVEYGAVAGTAMRDAINAKLQAMGSTLTARNIMDRATTQTCAGCHQVSNNVALGGGLTWPSSLGFVQISETGALSPALTTRFLPRRKQVLEAFLHANCTTSTAAPIASAESDAIDVDLVMAADSDVTLGGSSIGAAN